MNYKCTFKKCQLTPIRNGKCVLHCKKFDYSTDYNTSLLLTDFYNELIRYLVNNKNQSRFLPSTNEEKSWKDQDAYFYNIKFPERNSRDTFDYFKILKKTKSIHFDNCEFSNFGFNTLNLKMFYQECIFHNKWTVYNTPLLNNYNNCLYQDCLFKNEVDLSLEGHDDKPHSIFRDCNFLNTLSIEQPKIENILFNNNKKNLKINELKIKNTIFEKKLILNNINIKILNTENVSFNEKFEFKQNKIKSFYIFNTNFYKIFDAYETHFDKYVSEKCIFSDFSGFERCEFNKENKEIATFEYVTYLGFVNFRNASFYGGLNLENTNLKEPPNFLKVKIESDNTNRETFRIIKNAFDKSGNHIEANKYFSREMKEYKKELSSASFSQEKLIFNLNELISNFGMNYIRPILLIIFFSVFFELLKCGFEYNILYKIYPEANPYILKVSNSLNNIALNIMPFKRFLYPGMEFISLIFYIIFASLIWQTIVSIKKHTRNS